MESSEKCSPLVFFKFYIQTFVSGCCLACQCWVPYTCHFNFELFIESKDVHLLSIYTVALFPVGKVSAYVFFFLYDWCFLLYSRTLPIYEDGPHWTEHWGNSRLSAGCCRRTDERSWRGPQPRTPIPHTPALPLTPAKHALCWMYSAQRLSRSSTSSDGSSYAYVFLQRYAVFGGYWTIQPCHDNWSRENGVRKWFDD